MKKEKTMHELCKEFPEKTYRELELYRDADRQEEAAKIPLTESQQKQEELEPIGMGHNHPPEEKGICMMGEMRKDREESDWPPDGITYKEKYEKERKLRQEAEESLANALEVNEAHQKLNGKLQERLTDLEEEIKKMHEHLNKRIESARKAGL
jgi:hypothetical protein